MDFAILEKPIQEIITLAEKLDERYREKCFEILLNAYLKKEFGLPAEPEAGAQVEKEAEEKEEFVVPIDVRAFLRQQNLSEEKLHQLFLIEKDDVRPAYRITTTKKSAAQMQIALLTALENALLGNKFEFSIETIRERCKDQKIYDMANFKAHFKNNERYFKSLDDEEHVELSPEGHTELAEVISTVAK